MSTPQTKMLDLCASRWGENVRGVAAELSPYQAARPAQAAQGIAFQVSSVVCEKPSAKPMKIHPRSSPMKDWFD